jgi:hypothetical protein
MPSWFVLIRYARFARIPLEFIVDDDFDLEFFKHYLASKKGGALTDPPESTKRCMTLYWHGPK